MLKVRPKMLKENSLKYLVKVKILITKCLLTVVFTDQL